MMNETISNISERVKFNLTEEKLIECLKLIEEEKTRKIFKSFLDGENSLCLMSDNENFLKESWEIFYTKRKEYNISPYQEKNGKKSFIHNSKKVRLIFSKNHYGKGTYIMKINLKLSFDINECL